MNLYLEILQSSSSNQPLSKAMKKSLKSLLVPFLFSFFILFSSNNLIIKQEISLNDSSNNINHNNCD